MISNLSKKVVNYLILTGSIDINEKELYEYGLFILLSTVFFIGVTSIIGFVFGLFLQSLLFFVAFVVIRQFAGGYHASTELRCEIFTTLSIFFCTATMYLIRNPISIVVLVFVALMLSIFIFLFGPIDNEEKILSATELKVYRKRTRQILLVIIVVVIVSFYFEIKTICIPCCMSLILESILLLAGKIQKVRMGKCGKT